MKKDKIIILSLATLIGTSSILNGVSYTVFAQENTNVVMKNSSENENKKIGTENNKKNVSSSDIESKKSKTIYVKTAASSSGNGTENNPYNDFKTAYSIANEGDTIVLLNTVTIQNDDNSSDAGVFTFKKSIKITGIGSQSCLTSRVPIQLESNVTLENTELSTPKIYLNGYELNMNNVKRNMNNREKPTVYGGSHQGTKKTGAKSSLIVTGSVQNPFEFKAIYAGSDTGESNVGVSIQLNSGVKVEQGVNASGSTGKVNANVEFVIGNVNVNKFENTYNTANTNIDFKGYTNTNGPFIEGYKDVKLENSNITVDADKEFTGLSGKLELTGNSKLDISKNNSTFSIQELVANNGSIIVLNKDNGILDVKSGFTGNIEFRTPGSADQSTSGPVKLDWSYIKADKTSTGKVTFKPNNTQPNVVITTDETSNLKEWKVIEKKITNPIATLEVEGSKKV
uniref:hypothetical protein n=1 Tax=Clostridium sp. TaxID=1506 RepID=UPI002623ADD4